MDDINIPIQRPNIFASYIKNITEYLRRKYPNLPNKQIEAFVTKQIRSRCDLLKKNLQIAIEENLNINDNNLSFDQQMWPTVRCIKHIDSKGKHSYGNIKEYKDYALSDFILDYNDKIISPFGSVYETPDKIPSWIKGMVTEQKAGRKKEKKLMLKAKKEGDKVKAMFHNSMQGSFKFNLNSIPGSMGSKYNFLTSISNFNSVTSIARSIIMNAYAHAERFLESNFYFRNDDQLINHIISCINYGPDPEMVYNYCKKINLYIPTWQEVCDFLIPLLQQYTFNHNHQNVLDLIKTLHTGHLIFIYYMSNMKQLVTKNESLFRPWIDDFFSENNVIFSDKITPEDVYKLDGDLAIVVSTIYHNEFPVNNKGNTISIYDCVDEAPELAKRLACIGKYLQKKIDKITPMFKLFMHHNIPIAHILEHKNMYRKTVISSDTDSIIFTTKSWVQWYTGSLVSSTTSFNMNALVVYWASKANQFIMDSVARQFGAIGNDTHGIVMKNEFMMPVDILTSLKKHYASLLAIQEGVFYGTPQLDIKGVNFRGSNYSNSVLNYTKWFIQSAITDIYNTSKVSIKKKLLETLRFERLIYDSLHKGEVTYLSVDPIKNKEEYAKPESSIYFNYELWEAILAPKYGNIAIPTKCYIVPIIGIESKQYAEYLQQQNPTMLKNITKFIIDHPGKKITRIPINPLIDTIPEELRPIIYYRNIIYENTKPLYLLLRSFGMSAGNEKTPMLFSDIYGWVTEEEGQKAYQNTLE